MTEPVRMRADQLSVGDLVPDEYLPHRFNTGPAEVRFVAPDGEGHTFFAFRYPNGQHDSTTVLSESALEVYPAPDPTGQLYSRPADSDDPQPSGGREPMHTGAWTDGGLVDETPAVEMTPPPCGDHSQSELSCPVCSAQRRAFYAALGRRFEDEGEYLVSHGSPEREVFEVSSSSRGAEPMPSGVQGGAWLNEEIGLVSGGLVPNCPTCGGDHHTVEPCR